MSSGHPFRAANKRQANEQSSRMTYAKPSLYENDWARSTKKWTLFAKISGFSSIFEKRQNRISDDEVSKQAEVGGREFSSETRNSEAGIRPKQNQNHLK